ncbi:carboxypeptidase regulatory-like domain-containing protein, partial [bacterium]|nr:carboxypeptidase regulatory-like domain-containing protein [bacterium]
IAGFFLFQAPSAEGTEARSITVTSPKAGDVWRHGSTHNITWEATGAEYIYIDVVCGNNAWTFLGSDVNYPASTGSYPWTISDKYPNQIGACYVRVFLVPSPGSPSPGVDYDASDTFTIAEAEVARSITVTSPKAGDVWKYGSTHNITWEATGAEYVHIDVVFRENGHHAYTLFSSNDNISASSGSVSWTIGETWTADQLSGECYIRVFLYPIAWTQGVDYDKSDIFTIGETGEAKSITITSPNGGETWKSGEKHQITWDSVGVDAVNIYIFDPSISINGSFIATVYVATLGNYDWIIPSVSKLPGGGGSNYKIRIEDADDASTKDESDSYFSIVEGEAKSLYVTSPNGGQEWWIGKTYDITWNSTGIDEINIWLVDEAQENVQCTLSGMCCSTCGNWRPIASKIPAYKGSYPWTVPIDQTTGREYKILIRTVPDNCFDNCPPLDMSDNYFSIAEAGEGQFINVTVPNGGEKWWKGKTYDIRWASSGIENVHIDIAKFGSPSQAWTLVSNVPASKGSYPWTIGSKWKLPDQIPAGDTYKIRVFTYPLPPSGGWIEGVNYDQSDNYFSINEGDEPPPTETSVSGIVTDYSNQPVYEAFIDLHAADHSVGWGAKTDSRGYYFIGNVQPGNYIIDVYPPEGKTDLLRPNSVNITLMENESMTQNFQFLQATKTVKGSITLADGTPVTDAVVKAVRNGKGWSAALTDSSGNYLLKVTGGNWEIHVYPKNPDTANWFYDQPPKQVDFADDKTYEEKIVDIVVSSKTVLPDKAGVQGTVTDYTGQPVEHVEVVIYPSDHSFKRVSVTDPKGKYFISDLDPGAYILEVYLPQELMNFIMPNSKDITLLKGETLTENFQLLAATKTITGKVSFPDGTPLTTDVMVNAFKENAPGWAEDSVDSYGNYTLKVGGGNWMVMPHPKDHETANWSYFEPPKKVTFALDQTTEKAIVNFTVLRADARVTGRVLNPDGSAPDRYKVHVNISSSHGHGGGAKLDDSGTFSTAVPAGSYTLHIFCEDPTLGAPPLDPFSVVKGQTLNLGTIYLIKKNELIKGKVINEQGKGVANVGVEAFRPDEKGYNGTKTDSFGNYDLYVTTGEWMVTVFTDEASGYVYPEPPKQITISVGQTITLNFT